MKIARFVMAFVGGFIIGLSLFANIGCSNSSKAPPAAGSPAFSSDESPRPDHPTPDEPSEAPSTALWQSLVLQWEASEIPQGACPRGTFVLNSDGRFDDQKCGERKTGQISAEDLARLDSRMEAIAGLESQSLKCDSAGIADLAEDLRVRTPTGEAFVIFRYGEDGTCMRGSEELIQAFHEELSTMASSYGVGL